jgi:hypothetical protein
VMLRTARDLFRDVELSCLEALMRPYRDVAPAGDFYSTYGRTRQKVPMLIFRFVSLRGE